MPLGQQIEGKNLSCRFLVFPNVTLLAIMMDMVYEMTWERGGVFSLRCFGTGMCG